MLKILNKINVHLPSEAFHCWTLLSRGSNMPECALLLIIFSFRPSCSTDDDNADKQSKIWRAIKKKVRRKDEPLFIRIQPFLINCRIIYIYYTFNIYLGCLSCVHKQASSMQNQYSCSLGISAASSVCHPTCRYIRNKSCELKGKGCSPSKKLCFYDVHAVTLVWVLFRDIYWKKWHKKVLHTQL